MKGAVNLIRIDNEVKAALQALRGDKETFNQAVRKALGMPDRHRFADTVWPQQLHKLAKAK